MDDARRKARKIVEDWAEGSGVTLLEDDTAGAEVPPWVMDELVGLIVPLVSVPGPGPFTRHVGPILFRQRGQNTKLVKDLDLLPQDSQERLFRVLQDMEQEILNERRKRKRGQFFG
jgi:hypothetical protein